VPKIDKIVVNCGIGETAQNAKGLDATLNGLEIIMDRDMSSRASNYVSTFNIWE
ncbi:hypothetical protein RYX36_029500, partial [Vicia faba]